MSDGYAAIFCVQQELARMATGATAIAVSRLTEIEGRMEEVSHAYMRHHELGPQQHEPYH